MEEEMKVRKRWKKLRKQSRVCDSMNGRKGKEKITKENKRKKDKKGIYGVK
jgi:hypothetical protein